jgi:hypothetical protein
MSHLFLLSLLHPPISPMAMDPARQAIKDVVEEIGIGGLSGHMQRHGGHHLHY